MYPNLLIHQHIAKDKPVPQGWAGNVVGVCFLLCFPGVSRNCGYLVYPKRRSQERRQYFTLLIRDISLFPSEPDQKPCTPGFVLSCSPLKECLHVSLTCFLRCSRSGCFHCHQLFPTVQSFYCLLLPWELLACWEHQLGPTRERNRSL